MTGRVLLTGASGLLGTWLRRTATPPTSIVALRHRTPLASSGIDHQTSGTEVQADLRDTTAVRAAVAQARPSLVIHTAYARDRASIVEATRNIAMAVAEAGADLVHISSDAVFSGDGRPRSEDATPDPIWDYGRWKAEAERVAATVDRAAIVRLPLVVSTDPADHVVERIRTGASSGQPTSWFTDEHRQPALASDLADACWRIIGLGPDRSAGVWHLPGPETLSRHEIAVRVVANLDLPPTSIVASTTPEGTARPGHLDLDDTRARREIAWRPAPVLSD